MRTRACVCTCASQQKHVRAGPSNRERTTVRVPAGTIGARFYAYNGLAGGLLSGKHAASAAPDQVRQTP